MRSRRLGQRIDAGLTDASLRRGDGPSKRLVVVRIRDELEIRHEVADLASIVEPHRTNESVRKAATTQRLLERAALRIRTIQNGEVPQREPGANRVPWCSASRRSASRRDLLDDEVRLIAI